MYSALDVAEYVLFYGKGKQYVISNLKLQKILYFIEAEFLDVLKKQCFKEDIEAWDFGPVVPEVYREFRNFGASNIVNSIEFAMERIERIMTTDREVIEKMVDKCDNYSAVQLVEATHNQRPWKSVYKKYYNNIITKESIREYFS